MKRLIFVAFAALFIAPAFAEDIPPLTDEAKFNVAYFARFHELDTCRQLSERADVLKGYLEGLKLDDPVALAKALNEPSQFTAEFVGIVQVFDNKGCKP